MKIEIKNVFVEVPFCYVSENPEELNCGSRSCVHRGDCISTREGIAKARNSAASMAFDSARFKQDT